ncbi:hypothetical protein [Dolichospermum phage Dfl-JY45]
MRPLMRFWSMSITLGRFAYEPWEIETLADWQGTPGAFVELLSQLKYVVPFGDRLRIAGKITEQTRIGCGLASVMDADMRRQVVIASAQRASSTAAAGGAA